MLNTVRVVEQDNGAKVHFSLINYPLLFLEAIHKHTHMHRHSERGKSLVFRGKRRKRGREEEGNISRLSILSSTVHPNPLWK